MTDGAGIVDESALWRLRDERDFLRRSLDDAEQEHAAGDLSEADYLLLRRRDEARLAEVDAAIAAAAEPEPAAAAEPEPAAVAEPAPDQASEPGPTRRRHRRRRRWLGVIGAVLVLAGALVLVFEVAAPRLPGETPTGSVDLSQAQKETQQLEQARTLVNDGHPTQALEVYAQVLAEDPKDPVALAEWGWYEWQAGSAAHRTKAASEGQAAVAKAVAIEPALAVAQYYLGTILLDSGHAKQAVDHYRSFLADRPTAKWLRDAAPAIRKAFGDVGQPVPAEVPSSAG